MTTPIIAVFAGGTSPEREVSLGSGKAAALAMAYTHPTQFFTVDSDALPEGLDPARHIVCSTLHGIFGEDGGMQRLLEGAGVAYAGCDAKASDLTFDKAGLMAMANAGPNTNGSQFFITFGPAEFLNGGYTIFGQVIEGMDVVNAITRRDPDASPAFTGDVIESITITK